MLGANILHCEKNAAHHCDTACSKGFLNPASEKGDDKILTVCVRLQRIDSTGFTQVQVEVLKLHGWLPSSRDIANHDLRSKSFCILSPLHCQGHIARQELEPQAEQNPLAFLQALSSMHSSTPRPARRSTSCPPRCSSAGRLLRGVAGAQPPRPHPLARFAAGEHLCWSHMLHCFICFQQVFV